ncbi:MAG: DHH family phosphoesterase [Candidatus Anstonellales archaeon]
MKEILYNKWKNDIVLGDREPVRPDVIKFRYSDIAIRILNKHIRNKSNIVVHCDVDMDGIASGYIFKKFLIYNGARNNLFIINKEKEHGIKGRHVEFVNSIGADLMVVLDSSCNELDLIKELKCDVIVIDHHEILHDMLYIQQGNLEKVIITNMVDSDGYKSDDRMSCGLVVYELLRYYSQEYRDVVFDNLMLEQWVGVSLFSDVVQLANDRNQWYIWNTVDRPQLESSLSVILGEVNKYKGTLDKSLINYTIVPLINRAIRAGKSNEALDIILNKPYEINKLLVYKAEQDRILKMFDERKYEGDYILEDITNLGVSSNYCGVIASSLSGKHNKNTAVFVREGEVVSGSFRGVGILDYRGIFEGYGVYAQGHKQAFGFKLREDELYKVFDYINKIDRVKYRPYLTCGSVERGLGEYHIDDLDMFRREGLVWKLGLANSRVSTQEHVEIICKLDDIKFKGQNGKVFLYDVFGLEGKSFKTLKSTYISIYMEYSYNNINIYLK